jgi:acetate kinase
MESAKILIINCGSSSIKFQLISMPDTQVITEGIVERIGLSRSTFTGVGKSGKKSVVTADIPSHVDAMSRILNWVNSRQRRFVKDIKEIKAVGHRVVHGGEQFKESVIIDQEVMEAIFNLSDLAPLHNPINLEGIRSAQKILPKVPHVATFDTAYHQTIPDFAFMYGLPYEMYENWKIRRYGFHGTSHRYVAGVALDYCRRAPENTNLITCHLGNGCSITAISRGQSIDTSMGFTPLEGLVMGTRSGDLDPAILHFLHEKGYEDKEIQATLNKKSGLLGLSGVSSDLRDITREVEAGNRRAKLAIDVFAYRVKKYIGAYAAVMVKVDLLVFTGGIGQHSSLMRSRICENLENIGIVLDKTANEKLGGGQGIISTGYSPVTILSVPTNEELMIALDTWNLINKKKGSTS